MRKRILLSSAVAFFGFIPGLALACACGCGVFDVQTSSMFPTGEGGTVWAEYDFMNQNKNWSGTSGAPAANNPDKRIETNFFTVGGQYMFNRSWGVTAEVPYWDRDFSTTDSAGGMTSLHNSALGDVRIKGVYSGFSPDMSTGIIFGLKLPTGDYSHENADADWDRDTEIGTGSTDVLLGAYHLGKLTQNNSFIWFVNGEVDQPVLITAGYRPGSEFDAVTGVYYNQWKIGGYKIAPIGQVVGSIRLSDRGPAANPDNSGYKRLLLSPGIEVDTPSGWHLFADVSVPVYQQMIGNQLVASELFKVSVSHDF